MDDDQRGLGWFRPLGELLRPLVRFLNWARGYGWHD